MHRAGVPHLELTYMTGHSTRDILTEYVGLDLTRSMEKYFASIRPLLAAIANRAREVGITDADNANQGPRIDCEGDQTGQESPQRTDRRVA
jgi:hypothetical protein